MFNFLKKSKSKNTSFSQKQKLTLIIKELKVLKEELCVNEIKENKKLEEKELKELDLFTRKKYYLTLLLQDLHKSIDRLNEIRKIKNPIREDQLTIIQLKNENNKNLIQAVELLHELTKQLNKDKNKHKNNHKKLSQSELVDRNHLLFLFQQEIQQLNLQNSTTNFQEGKTEKEILERITKRKGNKKESVELTNIHIISSPTNPQEVLFEEKVAENQQEQDKILKLISDGLDELKELAIDMNKQLGVQDHLLKQTKVKIDHGISQFKTANQRLKGLLEKAGGLSRIIPIFICLLFLLGLLGYIFHIL